MTYDPVAYYGSLYPELFGRAVAYLESSGEASDQAFLGELRSLSLTAHLQFIGRGDVVLRLRDGRLERLAVVPAEAVDLSVVVKGDDAEALLDVLAAPTDVPDAAVRRLVGFSPRRVVEALANLQFAFFVHVFDAPDVGEVVIKVGIQGPAPADNPRFTVGVRFSDMEDLRDGRTSFRAVLSGGRLRFRGDYARPMAMALQLTK